jgi:hypothetical protein
MEDDSAFESFSCPITGSLMEDPVMTIGTLDDIHDCLPSA